MAVRRKLAVPLWDALDQPDREEYPQSVTYDPQAQGYDPPAWETLDRLASLKGLEPSSAHLLKHRVYF